MRMLLLRRASRVTLAALLLAACSSSSVGADAEGPREEDASESADPLQDDGGADANASPDGGKDGGHRDGGKDGGLHDASAFDAAPFGDASPPGDGGSSKDASASMGDASVGDGGPTLPQSLGCSVDGFCATRLSDRDLNGVWGSSPSDVWIVGDDHAIFHWNGTSFAIASAPVQGTADLFGIWGSGPSAVWVVGDHLKMFWDGTQWKEQSALSMVWSVYGTAANDVWVSDEFYTCHHAGWAILGEICPGTYPVAAGLWGAAKNDYWMVEKWRPFFAHWNGSTWTEQQVSHEATSIWGSATNDVWAAAGSYWLHWNGSAWATTSTLANAYDYGVAGSAANDVWGFGYAGALQHWNGSAWSAVASGTTTPLRAGWAPSAKEAWMVGDGGIVIHRKLP